MLYRTLLAALLCLSLDASAQTSEKYSRARVSLDKEHTLTGLAKLGVATDHGEHKKNTFFTTDLSQTEIKKAKDAGYHIDIVIDDVQKHYREQNKKKAEKSTAVSCADGPIPAPSHFRLGDYGGYFTYDDALEIIDSMRLLYPGLISIKQPISTFQTIEGRPIYWLRISNDPDLSHPTRPQMLTTAVHHAREPGGLSSTIFYMWYLLENYASDPHVKAILDNTELYFVPCLNPDGYLQNIATDPGGGGMWRKNMRDNLDGTFGVDINRNYGHSWGYDDIGSSPDPSSQTYRGTAGFSEPETQAIKWFSENHNFKIALNFHTFSNVVVYPWGFVAALLTPDSTTFENYASHMTQVSRYTYGTGDQTVGYVTNGDSDDWMYGEQVTKPKIFSFTPEIGDPDDGFYSPFYNILPDCKKNLSTNLNTASLLLPFADITPKDDRILVSATGYLHYDIKRLGLQDGATYSVSISSLSPWLTVPATPNNYMGLTLMQSVSDSFSYTLGAGTPNGQLIRYVLTTNNGLYNTRDTVEFYYGKKYNITTPTTSSFTGWINSGWDLCTNNYHSAPNSFKSSVGCDNYLDDFTATLQYANPIDLTYSTEAWLRFHAWWVLEARYDHAVVEASIQGSGTWAPLCGLYTKPGSTYQLPGEPIYDARRNFWTMEHMDLADYLGQKILLRFSLHGDLAQNYEGMYIDDIQVRSVQDTSVSVETVTGAPTLRTYPNPAGDVLNISVTSVGRAQGVAGALYDMPGRQVVAFSSATATTTLDVSTLPAGMYILRAYANGEALPAQKVVISR